MIKNLNDLSLGYTAIGSLPFNDKDAASCAVDYVFKNYKDIPFWAQLPHLKKEEDMVLQYTQNLAGFNCDTVNDKYFFDDESDDFFIKLEELFVDYEIVVSSDSLLSVEETLDKYKITEPYSNGMGPFLKELKNCSSNKDMTNNPKFIKGSITGPFTFATSLNDKKGKCAYYNETLREIIVKTLSLKALWQIKEFNKNCAEATPIIFMDEPSVSQVGSCAFLTVKNEDVTHMLKTISNDIKKFGALSGIHCCGKTDWKIATASNADIINFDAYFYAETIATFADEIKNLLNNGGFLSFGIIPTADKEILKNLTADMLFEKFEQSVEYLTKKGIDKNTILKQCFVTPSCGCGSLSEEHAIKALELTKELSVILKTKYGVIK